MKKIRTKEPKPLSLFLTAASGVSLGLLLGVALLLTRQPVTVSTVSEDDANTKIGDYNTYFTPGRVDGGESPNLRSGVNRIKRRTNGPVSFSEGEINYFFKSFEFPEAAEGEGGENPVRMGPFNVRMSGDQIFATLRVSVDAQGSPFDIMVLAKLGFENSDDGPSLVVESVRLNSLPIPGLAGVVTGSVQSTVEGTSWPEELKEMWQNIKSIEVESGKLITEVGLRRT